MQNWGSCGKLKVIRGMLRCPACGAVLIRVSPMTLAEALPIYCRKCRREFVVDIVRGQCYLSRSPGDR